jgi:hypothetical protein
MPWACSYVEGKTRKEKGKKGSRWLKTELRTVAAEPE